MKGGKKKMNYIGMDIHKQFTVAVVKDKEGKELGLEKFENSKENFNKFLKTYTPEETKIVMESTSVWEPIFDMIEDMRYDIKLANPVKTRAIAESRIKTDKVDASTLADLLRANLVAESYIPSHETRELRNIIRARKSLVQGKVKIKNKIHSVLTKTGLKLPYSTLCKSSMAWIVEEIERKDFTMKTIVVSYINILEQYQFEIKKIDDRLSEIALKNSEVQLLKTIPGIGNIIALTIISEIGDINRFESSKKLSSYAGLVPGIRQSGNILRFGRLIKQSSKNLKTCLIEASWVLVRTKDASKFKWVYGNLSKKKGKQKAICAIARRLCCVIYAMLKKNQTFMLL
jgi:transposase